MGLPDGHSYKTCTRQKGWWTVNCGIKYNVKCSPGLRWSNYQYDGSKCKCQLKPEHKPKRPSFVPTGLIQWKGTTRNEDRWWEPKDNIEGIMYKNDKGLFVLNQTFHEIEDYDTTKAWHKVKILIPDGKGKFTKITRSNTEKYDYELMKYVPTDESCIITKNVESSESLDQLWDLTKQGFDIGVNHWNLLEDGEELQKWGGKDSVGAISMRDYYHRVKWEFKVEKRGNFVVPNKFYKWMTKDGPLGEI